jgi:hypothetical protein
MYLGNTSESKRASILLKILINFITLVKILYILFILINKLFYLILIR